MPRYRYVPVAEPDDRAYYVQNPWWRVLYKLERWTFVSTLKAALYKKDWELIELSEKMSKLLAERAELADVIHYEVKDAATYKADREGRSESFEMSLKEVKQKIVAPVDRPDLERLTSFLHPKITAKYGLSGKYKNPAHPENFQRKAGPQNHGPHIPGMPGAQTGFTLPEFANSASVHLMEETGVDSVIAYKEDNGGTGGDRKSRFKQLRQQHPQRDEETQAQWDKRINGMLDKNSKD